MKNESKAQPVQSLNRALDILEFAARTEEGISLADITELLGISQGAAYNLSNTLVVRGYLKKSTRPVRFTVGDMLIELGMRQEESHLLRNMGEVMRELTEEYANCSTLFVVPQTYQLAIQLRTDPTLPGVVQRQMRVLDNPHAMITPLCLLAFLPQMERSAILKRYPFEVFTTKRFSDPAAFHAELDAIRGRGYALDNDSLSRVAVPVYDARGQLRGALGISFDERKVSDPELVETVHVMREKLQKISLGGPVASG